MTTEAPRLIRRRAPVLADLYREVVKDRVTGLAAEVAFFAVLSIFPGLLMVAAALGHLELLVGADLAERSHRQILDFLDLILTNQAAGALAEVEGLFEERRPGIITVAGLGALWALSRGFAAVIRALNLAYDVDERRSLVRLRLMALGLSVVGIIATAITLAMIVVGPLLGQGDRIADVVGAGDAFAVAWRWARWPVAFAIMTAGATTVFHMAPNRRRSRWRADLPGALFAATLWLVVSAGFSAYLRLAPGANAVLGALGGGLILLVWLYLLSLSLLLGGELNAVLAKRAGGEHAPVTAP